MIAFFDLVQLGGFKREEALTGNDDVEGDAGFESRDRDGQGGVRLNSLLDEEVLESRRRKSFPRYRQSQILGLAGSHEDCHLLIKDSAKKEEEIKTGKRKRGPREFDRRGEEERKETPLVKGTRKGGQGGKERKD